MTATSRRPVTVVTAASRGMGRACAEELARRGHALMLMARSPEIETVAKGLDADWVVGSVTEVADLERAIGTTHDRHGRIDGVVNNTGHPEKGDLLEIPDDAWHDALDLLVLSVVRTSRLVVPIMSAQGGGAIVNISTFGAREPSLAFPVSSALRASLTAFTKLFAQRHGAAGIRMNNVLPGFIDTYPVSDEHLAATPLGRAGRAEEIARTAAFLLSDEAGFITGQDLLVDGGLVKGM